MGNYASRPLESGNDQKQEHEDVKCHYEILCVDQGATPDELKKAYRQQALRHHPGAQYD